MIQRFFCKPCRKTYSLADQAYNHKKRRIHDPLRQLLGSCISLRRAALIWWVSRRMVARKLIGLGYLCRHKQSELLKLYLGKIKTIQVDAFQTIEHSKRKPLSVAMAVCVEHRKILGVEVSSMPEAGYLAAISRRKYGCCPDHRQKGLKRLFESILKTLINAVTIDSDKHPYDASLIKCYFPQAS